MVETQMFVYGSLQPGEMAFDKLCRPFLLARRPAWTLGRLYRRPDGYPIMIPASEPESLCTPSMREIRQTSLHRVQGWTLLFDASFRFEEMDLWEELGTIGTEEGGYERRLIEVWHQEGATWQPTQSWVYAGSENAANRKSWTFLPEGRWSSS